MKVLLDTCVVAEIRHPKGAAAVRSAVEKFRDDALFLSVVTVGEITKGIALLPPGKRKRQLADWLTGLDQQFANQILAIDRETVQIWGELTARAQSRGVIIPAPDGLIAATALRHGMHVMTRNIKHFAASGAAVIDPWEGA